VIRHLRPAGWCACPIVPGDNRALNKRIVEALANQCYWLELDNAPGQRVWAYRKAAWAIEDLPVLTGQARGAGRGVDLPPDGAGQAEGLEGIENVGPRLAEVVEGLLAELSVSSEDCGRPGRPG
jgi:hypothetical protein